MSLHPNAKQCIATANSGKQCTNPAIRGKNCCYQHGGASTGRPNAIVKETATNYPELSPLLKALTPEKRLAIARAMDTPAIEQIKENAAVLGSLAADFLTNLQDAPAGSDIIDAAQKKIEVHSKALHGVHQIEYDKTHLISGSDLLAILLVIQTKMVKMIRQTLSDAQFNSMGEREKVEQRLVEAVSDTIKRAIQGEPI